MLDLFLTIRMCNMRNFDWMLNILSTFVKFEIPLETIYIKFWNQFSPLNDFALVQTKIADDKERSFTFTMVNSKKSCKALHYYRKIGVNHFYRNISKKSKTIIYSSILNKYKTVKWETKNKLSVPSINNHTLLCFVFWSR